MKLILKVVLILSAILIVSWSIASALFFMSEFYANYNFNDIENYESAESSQNALVDGIKQIDIASASEDITIRIITGNEAVFNLSGTYPKMKYDEPPKLVMEKTEDSIKIHVIHKKPNLSWSFNSDGFKMEVGIPEKYIGDIKIKTASGNINFNDFKTGAADIATTSGDIEIKNSSYKNLILKSASGNLKLNKITISEDSYFDTFSGDIEIKDTESKNSFFSSISGNIQIEKSMNINSIETTSGDIEIKNCEIDQDLNLETVSGNIYMNLNENASVDVIFKSVSGDLENNFGEIRSGSNNIYVKTTSGDFNIN